MYKITSVPHNFRGVNVQTSEFGLLSFCQGVRVCLCDAQPLQPPKLDRGEFPDSFDLGYKSVEQWAVLLGQFVEDPRVHLGSEQVVGSSHCVDVSC